jgi:hypothetical protein
VCGSARPADLRGVPAGRGASRRQLREPEHGRDTRTDRRGLWSARACAAAAATVAAVRVASALSCARAGQSWCLDALRSKGADFTVRSASTGLSLAEVAAAAGDPSPFPDQPLSRSHTHTSRTRAMLGSPAVGRCRACEPSSGPHCRNRAFGSPLSLLSTLPPVKSLLLCVISPPSFAGRAAERIQCASKLLAVRGQGWLRRTLRLSTARSLSKRFAPCIPPRYLSPFASLVAVALVCGAGLLVLAQLPMLLSVLAAVVVTGLALVRSRGHKKPKDSQHHLLPIEARYV